MTRSELQALLVRDPAESDADYRLVMKQGNSSAEFHVNTAELLAFVQQVQQAVSDS